MKNYDLAIIGSGMGGALTAGLHQEYDHILFEQDKNLGGCASTFKRFGHYYNAGATTLVGYEDNHVLKKHFDAIGYKPDIVKSDIAIRVIQDKKYIDRTVHFKNFLQDLNNIYPHQNNQQFWSILKELDDKFWQLKHFYFAKHSFKSYFNSFQSAIELLSVYKKWLFMSATTFIHTYLPNISKEYQAFIDAQLLITVQSSSKEISLLTMALGLCYPFHDVYYAKGGMGKIIEGILQDVQTHNKESVHTIIKEANNYRIISNKDEYLSKNIVLNSTIYDSQKLFKDRQYQNYYKQFSFSDQSAFTLYITLKSTKVYLQHYQIILKELIPNCISNSFFVSFSKQGDPILSKKETYSITISTHTKANIWPELETQAYEEQKQITQEYILKEFLDNFDTINKEDIVHCFSGTAKTFKRYINRYNCGGQVITLNNILQTPTCTTPFKGLYHVGDTVFAGQGWPGVALGADILAKELDGKL